MKSRILHDGRRDGLVPLQSLSLSGVDSFADLLRAMSKTAFGGRRLGEAFEILVEMARRPQCRTVLTVSGAMTVAKQGGIICEMIERGLVHAVVCTGALIAHGLTESIGLVHYKSDPSKPDQTLYEEGYNRVFDTVEMEANLNDVQELLTDAIRQHPPQDNVWSSARICSAVGQHLDELDQGAGILRSAWRQDVPVFVPAFTDSEVGLDVSIAAMLDAIGSVGRPPATMSPDEVFQAVPAFNPFLDLQQYARFACQAKELGIYTIGGGVPRNWAQQIGPYAEAACDRLGIELPEVRFRYGVRICPEPAHWGGLSGCTYSEGVSWGKFFPPEEGGRYAEVHADATLVWPLLMKAVFEELDQNAQLDRDSK